MNPEECNEGLVITVCENGWTLRRRTSPGSFVPAKQVSVFTDVRELAEAVVRRLAPEKQCPVIPEPRHPGPLVHRCGMMRNPDIPAGWRRLHPSEQIRQGDYYEDVNLGIWSPINRDGAAAHGPIAFIRPATIENPS